MPIMPKEDVAAGAAGGASTGTRRGSASIPPADAAAIDTFATITTAKNALRGRKSALTKKIGEAMEIIGEVPNNGAMEYIPTIEDVECGIRAARDKILQTIEHLMEIDPGNYVNHENTYDDTAKAAKQALRETARIKAKIRAHEDEIADACANAYARDDGRGRAPIAAAAAAAAAAPAHVPVPKVIEALKPAKLSKDATPAEFRVWREQFKAFFEASNLDVATPSQQLAYVKILVDDHLVGKINAAKNDRTNGVACLDILCNIFKAKYPVIVKRVAYFNVKQENGEPFSETVTRMKNQAIDADIDRLDIDGVKVLRYLTAVKDEKLLKELIDVSNPNPEKLEEAIAKYEATKASSSAVTGSNSSTQVAAYTVKEGGCEEAAVYAYGEARRICNRCGINNPPAMHYNSCPAAAHRCDRCGRRGHFERICYNSSGDRRPGGGNGGGDRRNDRGRSPSRERSRYNDNRNRSDSRNRSFSRGRDNRRHSNGSDGAGPRMRPETPYNERINKVNGSEPTPRLRLSIKPATGSAFAFDCLPDTGATRSIMAADVADKYNVTPLRDGRNINLTAANGQPLIIIGKTDAVVEQGEVSENIEFLITTSIKKEVIISWADLKSLGAIDESFPQLKTKEDTVCAIGDETRDGSKTEGRTRSEQNKADDHKELEALKNKIINKYSDVVSDTLPETPMNGPPMKIHLKEGANVRPSRVMTARQVPIHHKKEADELVEKLIRDKIIRRINEPTEWTSPAFFLRKPSGGLRMVTDFSKLNSACERACKPFPTAADIVARIPADATVFCTMDALQGYHQIALDEESARYTAFLLPQGKFLYLRGPMGAAPTSDEWLIRSDVIVDNVDDTMKIVDDVIVAAPDTETLEKRIDIILRRCRERNITISLKKFKIGREVSFAGYIVNASGVKPDPERLEAVADFPQPKNVSELRSFMGLAQQLTTFVPDLAHLTDDLRQLLKKGREYTWLPEHQEAFEKTKTALTGDLCTAHFDTNKPTVVMTDASRLHGLGYALMQRDNDGSMKLVQCGSRSLSSAEKNYATIEAELLAVQWAVTKSHQFLAGAPEFVVATDHRPLVGIFEKSMDDLTNPRIVRLREKLARYNFRVTWVEGKKNVVADALSRAPVWNGDSHSDNNGNEDTCAAIIAPQPTDRNLQKIIDAANTDDEYKTVRETIGKKLKNLHPDHPAKQYGGVWETISVDETGLMVVDGVRVVIPRPARPEIIKILHEPHSGVDKTKRLARQLYYYPGIDKDIEDIVNSCEGCQRHQASKKEAPRVHTVATKPMEQISADLFDYKGDTYAAVVDRFSGYMWVRQARRQTAEAMIAILEPIVYENSIPVACRTDGGPCYRTPFTKWCEDNGITHQTSSPYRAQSNGHAESAVKIAKQLLDKVGGYNTEFKKALMEYLNAPREDGASPAQLFFGRRQRTALPAVEKAYEAVDTKEIAERRKAAITAESGEDSANDTEPEFLPGQRVIIQDPHTKKWTLKGTIINMTDTKRSYLIDFDDGRRAIRNRIYVRLSRERNVQGQTEKEVPRQSSQGEGEQDKSAHVERQQQQVRRSGRTKKPKVQFQF